METGSRSCTKWERGRCWGPEQPARGVTGHALGREAAGLESWGCRNLLKTLRCCLFFVFFLEMKPQFDAVLGRSRFGASFPGGGSGGGGPRVVEVQGWRGAWGWRCRRGRGRGGRLACPRRAAWPPAADEGRDGEGAPRLPAAGGGSCCGRSALYPLWGEHSASGTAARGGGTGRLLPVPCTRLPPPRCPPSPWGRPARSHTDTPRVGKGTGR